MHRRFATSPFPVLVLLILSPTLISAPAAADENYPAPPEATATPGVPQGRVEGPFEFFSDIFPGTERNYWVYIPAQYTPEQPACLMVVQDGLGKARGWKLPTVLDNLIHSGDVPVQLGVFVSPGVVPAAKRDAQPRYNRSYEYDGMTDRYARFLLEELLPEISKEYNISDNPNDRCIAGSSSGAICALTAAWHRPDSFRRVFSGIGTYVGLRGGNNYPTLLRKTEPKPIRIFLQDGTKDLDIYAGSWWHANQDMLSALQFAGYDVKHVWGEGGHSDRHGAAILPDALRWLWRDYPDPVTNVSGKPRRTDLLIDGEDWEPVASGFQFSEGPAVAPNGELYFTDVPGHRIHHVSLDGNVRIFAEQTNAANGLMFGPDGKLYACAGHSSEVVRYNMDGSKETVIDGVRGNDLVVLHDGSGYVTEPSEHRVWRFTTDGDKQVVAENISFPNGLIVSPDQTLLTVADYRGRFLLSWQIAADGQLQHRQEYGWLHVSDHLKSDADGMTVDTLGRNYVATQQGIQVLDQPGRVHFIIRKPQPGPLSNIVLGGPDRNILFATCGDAVYRRKINATGIDLWKAPAKPPRPRL